MQALVATAHKTCPERKRRIARTVYHLLKHKTAYQDSGAEAYDKKCREREVTRLRNQAVKLGCTLAAA